MKIFYLLAAAAFLCSCTTVKNPEKPKYGLEEIHAEAEKRASSDSLSDARLAFMKKQIDEVPRRKQIGSSRVGIRPAVYRSVYKPPKKLSGYEARLGEWTVRLYLPEDFDSESM